MTVVQLPSCARCAHWSPYLPGLGECLEYVKRRREAFARADDTAAFNRDWPKRPADDTLAVDSCARFEAAP